MVFDGLCNPGQNRLAGQNNGLVRINGDKRSTWLRSGPYNWQLIGFWLWIEPDKRHRTGLNGRFCQCYGYVILGGFVNSLPPQVGGRGVLVRDN